MDVKRRTIFDWSKILSYCAKRTSSCKLIVKCFRRLRIIISKNECKIVQENNQTSSIQWLSGRKNELHDNVAKFKLYIDFYIVISDQKSHNTWAISGFEICDNNINKIEHVLLWGMPSMAWSLLPLFFSKGWSDLDRSIKYIRQHLYYCGLCLLKHQTRLLG